MKKQSPRQTVKPKLNKYLVHTRTRKEQSREIGEQENYHSKVTQRSSQIKLAKTKNKRKSAGKKQRKLKHRKIKSDKNKLNKGRTGRNRKQ